VPAGSATVMVAKKGTNESEAFSLLISRDVRNYIHENLKHKFNNNEHLQFH